MTRFFENIHELATDRQASLATLTEVPGPQGLPTKTGERGAPVFRRVRPRVRRSTYDEAEERRARLSLGAFLTAC